MVDHDEVACFPRVALPIDLGVAPARDDVQPRLAPVAVARLIQARRELVHDGREAGGVVPDRLVDEEEAARTALRDEATHVVEARDEPSALRPRPLLREALRPARVGIAARDRLDL